MTAYVITFVIMLGVFMVGCFALKLPVGVSMMIAALCGAIQGGLGVETLRMMVEGEFGYVDTILTIGCAMIFMKVIEDSGALDALSSLIIEKYDSVTKQPLRRSADFNHAHHHVPRHDYRLFHRRSAVRRFHYGPGAGPDGNRRGDRRFHHRHGRSAGHDCPPGQYRRADYLRRH